MVRRMSSGSSAKRGVCGKCIPRRMVFRGGRTEQTIRHPSPRKPVVRPENRSPGCPSRMSGSQGLRGRPGQRVPRRAGLRRWPWETKAAKAAGRQVDKQAGRQAGRKRADKWVCRVGQERAADQGAPVRVVVAAQGQARGEAYIWPLGPGAGVGAGVGRAWAGPALRGGKKALREAERRAAHCRRTDSDPRGRHRQRSWAYLSRSPCWRDPPTQQPSSPAAPGAPGSGSGRLVPGLRHSACVRRAAGASQS